METVEGVYYARGKQKKVFVQKILHWIREKEMLDEGLRGEKECGRVCVRERTR